MNKEEQDARLLELEKMYQDNLSIWNGEEFLALKTKFKKAKKDYLKFIEDAKARSVKQIVSKGAIYDVFPFEVEQHGFKRNGKVIPEIIINNNCYIHHFDSNDRLILKENMSEFLKIPAYFSLYYYTDTFIEYIYGSSDIYRYQIFELEDDGKFVGSKTYAVEGKSYMTYEYENDLIVRSNDHYIKSEDKPIIDNFYIYDYLYDKQGKLSQIFCNYPFGGKGLIYSTQKVNFKKLEERIFVEMRDSLSQFLEKHKGETFTRFGIDSNSPDYLYLCLDDSDDEELLYYLADWKYLEIGEITLIDYPLDDAQNNKLLVSIAKALVSLVSLEEFKPLFSLPNFKIVFLDHQDEVKELSTSVKKILSDKIYY